LTAAVKAAAFTVTVWEETPLVTEGAFAEMKVPLAAFTSSRQQMSMRLSG
jgi:hypothetical protein